MLGTKVHAQQQFELPVVCSNLEHGFKMLEPYNEEPIFLGEDGQQGVENLKLMVTVNEVTKTFSVIFYSEQQSRMCVVSTGTGFKNYFK